MRVANHEEVDTDLLENARVHKERQESHDVFVLVLPARVVELQKKHFGQRAASLLFHLLQGVDENGWHEIAVLCYVVPVPENLQRAVSVEDAGEVALRQILA